jgi:tetratricopeptide (TPR) repeat protein
MALLILGGHAVGTSQRNTVWRSADTLWRDVVEKSPANGRAWMNYGLTHMARGKYAEAKRLFEHAQRYAPNYAYLEINLGIVTDRLEEPTVAAQHFRRALHLQPDFADGHYYYARWLVQQARSDEAIQHLQRAVALSPGLPQARTLLMHLYAAQGAEAALHALAQETLAVLPTDPVALAYASGEMPSRGNTPNAHQYYNRGVALTKHGRHLDAALVYRQALRLDPTSADAANNLGWSLAKLGFYNAAMLAFERAVRLRPSFTLAENNLRWVQTQTTPAK